jgi:predicted Zn-dependent protease
LLDRAVALSSGGGDTTISVVSRVIGTTRWAGNRIYMAAQMRPVDVHVIRNMNGAMGRATATQIDDVGVRDTVRNAERVACVGGREFEWFHAVDYDDPIVMPVLWSDSTYAFDAEARTRLVEQLIAPAAQVSCQSAGELLVTADVTSTRAPNGTFRYYASTGVECSVTVRDAKGTASGWAGVNHYTLEKIDPAAIAARALDKCRRSANPVAIEPGRYTTILEPQALSDLFSPLFSHPSEMDRIYAEEMRAGPWVDPAGGTKITQRVLDERLRVSADPMDPEGGFVPFDREWGTAFRAVDWIDRGVLLDLSYPRGYALQMLGFDHALPNSGSFRLTAMPGVETATVDEMIARTERGVLVTRFSGVRVVDDSTMLSTGFTRDGLWLVERGKISKAIKNFRFNESPLFALNNLEDVGTPVRVFAPGFSYLVPPVRVRDFSFVGLADAV